MIHVHTHIICMIMYDIFIYLYIYIYIWFGVFGAFICIMYNIMHDSLSHVQ